MIKKCENDHTFFKTSECPVCPICENNKGAFYIPKLSAPARRALENNGIDSFEKLANYSEKELLKLHGIGKSTIPILKYYLKA
jgi:hypothetical protein